MASIVCKFGGSSLASADRMQRIRRIIEANPDRRYIVVSAPGKRNEADRKITDLLIDAANAPRGENQLIVSRICKRYSRICKGLRLNYDPCPDLTNALSGHAGDRDYMASRGEYICARIMAEYLRLPFVDAENLIRLRSDGRIDVPASRAAIQSVLSSSALPRAVIPGFYGIDPQGKLRTLPRGGSDVTGAMIANAIRASVYENWTDVDGICSVDPAISDDARTIGEISKRQMLSVAEAGAGVLHPDAVSILLTGKTDIHLKNTFHPDGAGTRISNRTVARVSCIAHRATERANQMEISVFYPPEAMLQYIYSEMNPIHIIHMRDRIRIIVPNVKVADSIRILEKML